MKKKCIVVNESVSEAEMDRAAYKKRWGFSEAIKDNEGSLREVVFREIISPKGITDNFIRYKIEKVKSLPYLIIDGESIDTLIKGVYDSLPIHTPEEIIQMIQAPEDREIYLKGIIYLGLKGKFKECDAETLGLFKQVLQDRNPEVRNTAIVAISYTGWSELRELVQPLAETDPDPQVRQTASQFLSGVEIP